VASFMNASVRSKLVTLYTFVPSESDSVMSFKVHVMRHIYLSGSKLTRLADVLQSYRSTLFHGPPINHANWGDM
jgi:hypothetical protein